MKFTDVHQGKIKQYKCLLSVPQINHSGHYPYSVCRICCRQCVPLSDCLACPASSFQLRVCPVWAWLFLWGFPWRKYVVWSSQVLFTLSIIQKLPDEWESNHSSPRQNSLNCIQAWIWLPWSVHKDHGGHGEAQRRHRSPVIYLTNIYAIFQKNGWAAATSRLCLCFVCSY